MGLQAVPQDEEEEMTQNQFTKDHHIEKMIDIPSLPYQIDFSKPVIKVDCGESFGALLSANG